MSCASRAGPRACTRCGPATTTARVLIVSTRQMPQVAVYPDSDKVGVFTDDPATDARLYPREANVDYYLGER